jgi:hypothetical protein
VNIGKLSIHEFRLVQRLIILTPISCETLANQSAQCQAQLFSETIIGRPGHIASHSMLHMQVHQLGRWHQVVVQIGHDPERAGYHQENDQHAEGQCQHIVGVVRGSRDV